VRVDELAERVRREQRDVAVGHHHYADQFGQCVKRARDRVAGAELLVLHSGRGGGSDFREMCDDLVAAMADDDGQVLGLERGRRRDGVADEAATAELMQDLGDIGLHPGALARCENDHGGRACAHLALAPGHRWQGRHDDTR
jgi:hypothetical protein